MKEKKVFSRIVIGLFIATLICPLCGMNWIGGGISKTENRYLAGFPISINQETKKFDVSRSAVENWISDNIGFRDSFVDIYTGIKFKLLGISTSDRVEKGLDGWYFYTLDHNLSIASETYPDFDEEMLQKICEQQIIIRDKLKEQGREYVLILPPSKVSIYPEKIASGNFSICDTPADMLAEYLEKHSDIHVVRLKETLLSAKESDGKQLYFKTDTHWTEYGAYVSYKKIIEDMNRWGLLESGPAAVDFSEGTYCGEFAAMLGNSSILGDEPTEKAQILNTAAHKITEGDNYNHYKNLLESEGIFRVFYLFSNSQIDGPNMLIFGDSMFEKWKMPEMLAENFSSLSYVWDYNIRQSIIDDVNPDIVAYEMTERFLNQLTGKSHPFMQNVLTSPDAKILSQTIPEKIVCGEPVSFSVTVQNTGAGVWRESDMIRLGIFINGQDSSIRAMIPDEISIDSGESYTFTFENFKPPEAGSELKFIMLQEGVTYFGDFAAAETEIVSK